MICYLVINRIQHKVFTYAWTKSWIKRIVHIPHIAVITVKNTILKFQGTVFGDMTIISCSVNWRNASKLKVGEHSFIAKGVKLALHDEILIGSHVVINAGVSIYTASHDFNHPSWPLKKKKILIDDYAWIASDSIVLPGITIGYGAVIGAGSVVREDVPPYAVVTGNPAKIVKYRKGPFSYSPTAFTSPIECWLGSENFKSMNTDKRIN
jgi:acetyltransferase-like isoleucine patch superfamily enzyme